MSAKKVCYYTNESFFNRDDQGYMVAKVTAHEPGYEVVATRPKLADANDLADRMNEFEGLSRDEVLSIVTSSMAMGPVPR